MPRGGDIAVNIIGISQGLYYLLIRYLKMTNYTSCKCQKGEVRGVWQYIKEETGLVLTES